MEVLRTYLKGLTADQKADFAHRAGTTLGYIYNVLYTPRKRFSGLLARMLDEASYGAVPRAALRPDVFGEPRQVVANDVSDRAA